MKKSITKSFGIILSIFFAFACVLISGCGNKYKKMEFEVQYAFSSNAETWYDVDDEISLIMGEDDDQIKKDDYGVGTIYVRINISGVKSKHIDDIVVSKLANGSPSFSSVKVKEGEVFPIEIHETEKVENTLKIYETKSKKSKVIDLNIYQELTEIKADTQNNPAVFVGGTIDLKKYNNLKFLSNGRNGLVGEKQKQVEYSILSVGYYNDGAYVSVGNFSGLYASKLVLNDGVLSVDNTYDLTNSSYIVRMLAKSTTSEVAGEFDVYLVDKAEDGFDFKMNYATNQNGDAGKEVEDKFTLYPGNSTYNQVMIVVDTANASELYLNGLNSSFGTAKYKPVVYIDGEVRESNISQDSGIGFDVKNNGSKYIYTFTAFPTGKYDGYDIEIRMEIEGLDFSYATKPDYSDKCVIEKKVLPQEILINNDAEYVLDTVYLKDDSYNSIDLTINTLPIVDEYMVNYTISMTTDAKIEVRYAGKSVVIGDSEENKTISNIAPGTKMNITLDPKEADANIIFSIQKNPNIFKGENIAMDTIQKVFTLNGKITAREAKVYADEKCEKQVNMTDKPLLIDANNDTSFYVKVWTKNIYGFDLTSVSLDAGGELLFGGNKEVASLSTGEFVTSDPETNTAIYKMTIKGGYIYGKENNVYVNIAGYGVGYTFTTKAVNTIAEESSIKVVASNAYIKDMSGENKYFAMEHGQKAQLIVEGKIAGLNKLSSGAIEAVSVVIDEEYDLDNTDGKFSAWAISPSSNSNPIELVSNTSGKTQALKVSVSYYVRKDSDLQIKTDTLDIQVATYNPIKSVELKTDKDEIVYVNKYFDNAAKTSIEFVTEKNIIDSNKKISTELNFGYFDEGGEYIPLTEVSRNNSNERKTVTGLKVYTDVMPSEKVSYYLVNDGLKIDITDFIKNNSEIKLGDPNLLNGELVVELHSQIEGLDEINISVVATRFNKEDTVADSIKIKVAKHDNSMTDIRLIGSAIKNEGNDSDYIFMTVGEELGFTAQSINTKNNRYTDLAYKLYKVIKDTEGEISYKDSVAQTTTEVGSAVVVTNSIEEETYRGLQKDGTVPLKANNGGLYVMEIYSLDSYDESSDKFKNVEKLFINVSDGTVENPYIIRSATDFNNIQSDKHYVLGRDFGNENTSQSETLIDLKTINVKKFATEGKDEVAFTGSIKGTVDYLKSDLTCNKTVRHTLKYASTVSADGVVALFKTAGNTARFENFDIITSFNFDNNSNLGIAGLVYSNAGTIKNVGLTINNSTINSTGEINFGGLACLNSGTIDLMESNILVKKLTLNDVAKDSNVGLVVANNSGTIKADYAGIESLDELSYDVMGNVIVETNNLVNVGGVVGTMTAGQISNIIVGGSIMAKHGGNVAGIAANAKGNINTVATFALDLSSEISANIAGIVASSQGVTIENVRVESAEVEFTSLGITTYGKISSTNGVVAGIVANSNNNDTIKYAAVESFIDTIKSSTYYMLKNTSGEVYGLAKGGNKVENSFVDANIAGATITLTSGIEETNTYFIGDVNKDYIDISSTNATYAVLYNDVEYKEIGDVDTEGTIWSEVSNKYNTIYLAGRYILTTIEESDFESLKDTLYIKVGGKYSKLAADAEFDDKETYYIYSNVSVNNSYPYLLRNEKPFMIIRPTDLNANISESKIEAIDSIYISEKESGIVINRVDFNYTTDDIDEIVIINYFQDNEALNTYKITDLISSFVEPPESTGGIMFKIVNGSSFARIENNTNIVFTAVGGRNPIIVKCYSVINPSLVRYVVFYTEFGYTDVTMSGSNIETQVGSEGVVEYLITINTAPNTSTERIEINAENLKDDFYTDIFDANNDLLGSSDFIEITPIVGTNGNLIVLNEISPTSLTTFGLKYNQGSEFDGNSATIDIRFEVKLNLTKYFGEAVFPKQGDDYQYYILKTLNLKVTVVKTATSLTITNKPNKISTDAALTFNAVMETGYFGLDGDKNIIQSANVTVNTENNTISFNETNKDSMYVTISAEDGYEDRVLNLLKQAGLISANETECKNIPELFDDFAINYVVEYKNDKAIGYKYTIKTNFVEEYNFRYITSDIKLKFNVYSKFNEDICDSFVLTIKPAALSSAEIKNYTVSEIDITGEGVYKMFEIEKADSYIISPGNRGGIMVINLEPSYANLDWNNVQFTSTPLYVPELGREVYLTFEQVAYNRVTQRYETVPYNDYLYSDGELKDISVEKGEEKGIKLFPFSEISGDTTIYTGKIYVYVGLTYFYGYKGEISAKLYAPTLENDVEKEVRQEIILLTQYLPGVSITYPSEYKFSNGYLIQENTSSNVLNVKLYGYQFVPTQDVVSFRWARDDVSEDVIVYDYVSYRIDKNVTRNTDGSISMKIYLRVGENLPSAFIVTVSLELTMDDGQTKVNSEQDILFYPTDYILKSVQLEDIFTVINTNNRLNLYFNTNNYTYDYSDKIYAKLLEDLTDGTDYTKLLEAFSYTYKGKVVNFNDVALDESGQYPEFDIKVLNYRDIDNNVTKYITIQTKGTFNSNVTFNLNFGYEDVEKDGTYKLVFGPDAYTYTTSFNLRIDSSTTEENAIPIDSAEKFIEFMTYGAGQDFILINDIELEDYTPIATQIASLDGNNRIIKIKSFASSSDAVANYGLFSSFGTCTVAEQVRQSILKNVLVDYSELEDVIFPSTTTEVVFGGLVANNNGGLIYNCDVINLSTQEKTINLYFDGSTSQHKFTFGGLVGVNGSSSGEGQSGSTDSMVGTITNSRVGRKDFKKISVDTYENVSETKISSNKIKFVIGYSNNIEGFDPSRQQMNSFVGIAGAFVGKNSGMIASSYAINTSLISYSTSQASSKTAGFAAENAGKISYSYVQADPNTITSAVPYSTGAQIESATNGKVAGFVYSNNGQIDNSYANIELVSHSNFMAGFVYENTSLIKECYSACKLNVIGGSDISEQPFIGSIDGVTTLSTGEIENSYYYKDSSNFNLSGVPAKDGKNQATGLSLTNFRDSEMLYGFVFVLADSLTESEQGVWSYYVNGSYRSLPELTSTNMIATSYRYLTDKTDDKYEYTNAIGYEQGSKENPYIIRSVEEYNQIMTANNARTSVHGYIRFISDIDFTGKDISTHANGFVLGDNKNKAKTIIDGNGMTLSGIYLDAPSKDIESIGMFAEIQNAYIKNLNLKFDKALYSDKFSSISVKYSGGLAGKIYNSVIINISLDGKDTTLAGSNAVGGLAGIVTGSSLIYGIDSNLSVIATEHDTRENYYLYSSSSNISDLCYAGGLAGIIDITQRGSETYNISYVNIYGNEMSSVEGANISGDYVGGIAGYAGSGTSSFKLKYYTGTSDKISGGYVAGGLFGFSMGKMVASQVTAVEGETLDEVGTQYAYDTTFGSYIIDLKDNTSATLNKDNAGNLSLISSTYYAGGLIGIGVNAEIESSYSKASFKSSQIVGGLIGVSVSSKIKYSYAVTYVNVDQDTINDSNDENDADGIALQKVGGLIGVALAHNDQDRIVLNNKKAPSVWFDKYNNISLEDKVVTAIDNIYNNDFQFTFSTLILDHKIVESDEAKDIKFDYISADFMSGDNSTLRSETLKDLTFVYAGIINYNHGYLKNITCLGEEASAAAVQSVAKVDLHILYDVNHGNNEIVFDRIFSMWPTKYWTLNRMRYFPLLIDREPVDRIEIYNASDILKIASNPDGDFIVKNDIDMNNYTGNTVNWIVEKTFTGTIIGDVDNLKRSPVIKNIKITETQEGKNVGFFASSSGALFSDINFSYAENGINLSSNGNTIGGLVANDQNSRIVNVKVGSAAHASIEDGNWTQSSNGGMINVDSSNTAKAFGGIVGESKNTTIRGCEFLSNLTISIDDGVNSANFGGLAGSVSYEDIAEEFEGIQEVSKMTISSSKVNSSEFNITAGQKANIGGAIGSMNVAVVDMIEIRNNNFNIKAKVNEGNEGNEVVFGGLIGLVSNNISNAEIVNKDKLFITSNDVRDSKLNFTANPSLANAYVAGLIGYYKNNDTTTNITSSNADMDINFAKGKINTLYVAQGISYVDGVAKLKSNLFAGSIDQQDEADIYNVHVAGAVAYSTATTLELQEIMTTTDIVLGSKDTVTFISGGLVGYADVANIKYCVSTGRIVPTTSEYREDQSPSTKILIGGLAGWIKTGENKDVINSYTTTSIITGGLGNDVMRGYEITDLPDDMKNVVRINALFGYSPYVDENIENVFYSTDVALCPEDSKLGTNLPAYKFYYDNTNNVVYKGVASGSEGFWAQTSSATTGTTLSKLPYIYSLTSTLNEYGILKKENSHYTYDMGYTNQMGSALKPIIIGEGAGDYNFDNNDIKKDGDKQYCYFLISQDLNNLNFKGSLNGILIGSEKEYKVNLDDLNAVNEIYGVVPHVSIGSAVSNLHITLNSDETISTNKNNFGVVVGKNEGIVFNSSTQGIGVKFDANAHTIGMITHTNVGTVSHSFSSVEVLKGSSTIISGITYIQGGKLISNYFTGYASEEVASAAGIIYQMNAESSYTYNCYMAGVIKCEMKVNSFTASNFSSDHTGSNNFVDKWSNIETLSGVVQSIDTVNLMAGSINTNGRLAGNWTSIIKSENLDIEDETEGETKTKYFQVNTAENSGFGRNYGYPIYDMNKFGDSVDLDSLAYYLNTGTGRTNPDETVDWYKIPHLGVFSIVDGMLNAGQTGRNYLFIYDIDAKNTDWSKHAVGRIDKNNAGDTSYFTGTISSNLNFTLSEFKLDNATIIENLAGSGLLNTIGASKIEFIKFGSMSELVDSGAIGQHVIGKTTVNSIEFIKNSILTGTSITKEDKTIDTDVAALFGTISVNITINNWKFADSNNFPTISNAGNAGLIAANMTTGTLSLGKTIYGDDDKTAQYFVNFSNCTMAGGLVGNIFGGSISSGNEDPDNNHARITIYSSNNNTALGGIIGVSKEGEAISITNVDFIRPITPTGQVIYSTKNFGGLVCDVKGSITFDSCSIILETNENAKDDNNIKLQITVPITDDSDEDDQGFGYMAGKITKGILTVNGFNVKELKKDNTYGNKISAYLSVDGPTNKNAYNVGGIAGRYVSKEGSAVIIDNSGDDSSTYGYITSKPLGLIGDGVENFGGAFGYVSGILDATQFRVKNEDNSEFEFLTNSERANQFANVQAVSGKNMGGLIGKVAGGTISGLINKNPISMLVFSGGVQATQFTNVGGVFGYVSGAIIYNLVNYAPITYATYEEGHPAEKLKFVIEDEAGIEMLAIYNRAYGNDGSELSNVRTLNAGGIAGYAKDVTIAKFDIVDEEKVLVDINAGEEIINLGEVQGYQNVGGIFGYATNVLDLIISKKNDIETGKEFNGDKTYFLPNGDSYKIVDSNNLELDASGKITTNNCYAKPTSYLTSYNTIVSEGKVVGVLNVGGAFGCVEEGVIYGTKVTKAEIYGNVNVGGFAGYAPSGEYNFNTITGSGVNDIVQIKGVYYAITSGYSYTDEGNYKNKSEYYIPTSIGGFIGKNIPGDSTSADVLKENGSTLYGNTISGLKITTTEEGWPSLQTGYNQEIDGSSIISTIKNNVLNAQKTNEIDKGTATPDFWNGMKSGIGGFVGTTNSISLGEDITTNILTSVEIDATLGINVGSYYGYYCQVDSTTVLKVPKVGKYNDEGTFESGEIKVSGAYIVGGLIGFCDLATSKTLDDLEYVSASGSNILVQGSNTTGMYVGGLIGRLNGSAKNIKLISGITINTKNDYYIGGLFGRLEGNLKSSSGGGQWTGTTVEGLEVKGNSTDNFGGLVGMLKVNSQSLVEVQGKHLYWFTVNTIENVRYEDDAETVFGVYNQGGVYVSALAYYVNLDQIEIAGSSMSLKDETGNATNDWNKTKGPWGSSEGWAKEYTMFRVIQRNIPQASNNGAEWDSLAVLYDANAIREVYTRDVQINDKNDSTKDDLFGNGKTNDTGAIIKDYIDYTIYEDTEGSPIMYTSFGVATAAVGKPTEGYNKYGKEQKYTVDNAERTMQFKYIYKEDHSKIVTDFTWKTDGNESGYLYRACKSFSENPELTQYYYAVKPQYKMNGKETWFVFDSLFGHTSLKGVSIGGEGTKGGKVGTTTVTFNESANVYASHASYDGCLFNVSGSMPEYTEEWEEKTTPWWMWLIAAVLIVLCVVAAFFTGGSTLAAIPVAANLVIIVAVKTTFAIVATVVAVCAGLAGAVMLIISLCMIGNGYSTYTYLNKEWQSYGFISQTYVRELNYGSDGKLQYLRPDTIIFVGTEPYYYYSEIKPADYYQNRYYSITQSENVDRAIDTYSISQVHTDPESGYIDKVYIEEGDTTVEKTSQELGGIYDYYVYSKGAYYITSFAGTISYVPVQSDCGLTEYVDYVTNASAIKFVRGSSNAGGTNYELGNNNSLTALEYNNGVYYVNNIEWSNVASRYVGYGLETPTFLYSLKYEYYKSVPVGLTVYDGYTKLTKNVKYSLGEGIEGKMKSILLTKDGASASDNDYSFTYWELDELGAKTYKYSDETIGTTQYKENAGGNYVYYNESYITFEDYSKIDGYDQNAQRYEKGMDNKKTIYYKYSELSQLNPYLPSNEIKKSEIEDKTAKIYLAVNATEFTNETSGIWISKGEEWYLHKNYYTDNADVEDAEGLTYSPTYYYYEEKYISTSADGSMKNPELGKFIWKEVSSSDDEWNATITLYDANGMSNSLTIQKYFEGYADNNKKYTVNINALKVSNSYIKENDKVYFITYTDLNKNGKYDSTDLLTNRVDVTGESYKFYDSNGTLKTGTHDANTYETYQNYYIKDISKHKAIYSYAKGEDLSKIETVTGTNDIDDDAYYILTEKQVINGLNSQIITNVPNSAKYWYYNKYFINPNKNFYTRYRYTRYGFSSSVAIGTIDDDNDSTTPEKEVYIIPSDDSNDINATYLVESVNITLSGSMVYLKNTKDRTAYNKELGYIKLSIPKDSQSS